MLKKSTQKLKATHPQPQSRQMPFVGFNIVKAHSRILKMLGSLGNPSSSINIHACSLIQILRNKMKELAERTKMSLILGQRMWLVSVDKWTAPRITCVVTSILKGEGVKEQRDLGVLWTVHSTDTGEEGSLQIRQVILQGKRGTTQALPNYNFGVGQHLPQNRLLINDRY